MAVAGKATSTSHVSPERPNTADNSYWFVTLLDEDAQITWAIHRDTGSATYKLHLGSSPQRIVLAFNTDTRQVELEAGSSKTVYLEIFDVNSGK